MPRISEKKTTNGGFQLIEIIIASAILLLLAHSFFTLILAAYQLLGLARIQASARSLATNQMEIVRNLPFDQIGTAGGIPNGSIPQTQTVNSNGEDFTINTSILYIDDPFDGIAPDDLLASDYKRVKVQVTWTSTFPTQEMIELISDIAPKGPESEDGGGTLAILVFDSLGQPVPQADVHIQADTTTPPINLNLFTDNFGNLIIPGAPICDSCYMITVTKSGYSTARTYSNLEVTNPSKPLVTIIENQVSDISFGIDQLSSVTLKSLAPQSSAYAPIPGTPFRLISNKTIGTDDSGNNIYKLDQNYATDSNGNLTLELEWDNYTLFLDNSTQTLAGSNPIAPFAIIPNTNIEVGFISAPPAPNSLLSIITDASGSSVPAATVKLFDLSTEIIQTTAEENFPDFGQTFFIPPQAGEYSVEVTHPNYQTATQSVTINNATTQTIILNPL